MAGAGFNRLPLFAEQLPLLADRFVRKAAFDIQANAQANAPVDTGFLKASIYTVAEGGSGYEAARAAAEARNAERAVDQVALPSVGIGQAAAMVVVGASYGLYVEMGSVHMAPRPFLAPAVARVKPQFDEAFRRLALAFGL